MTSPSRQTRNQHRNATARSAAPAMEGAMHWPHPGDGVFDRLPPEEQEVMILSSFYGLAKDEIAAVIGASVDMVDTLISHAVEHVRRRLTGSSSAGPQAA